MGGLTLEKVEIGSGLGEKLGGGRREQRGFCGWYKMNRKFLSNKKEKENSLSPNPVVFLSLYTGLVE